MDVVLLKDGGSVSRSGDTQARHRAIYIASVALFPVLITSLFFCIVLLFVDPDASVGRVSEYASIENPPFGKVYSEKYQAHGYIKKLPAGGTAYLMEKKESLYWPKKQLGDTASKWEGTLRANSTSGFQYNLVVVSLSQEGLEKIEKWITSSDASGIYNGIPVFEGLKELASLRIIKE